MTLKIVTYVGSDTQRFNELMNAFLEGPYRITQRASWPISLCVERNPKMVAPHLNALINSLKMESVHVGVKRNILRMLQFISIPKRLHGKVINLCFDFLQSHLEPIAVKVFAMTVLEQITAHEPDLKNELRIILEDQLPYGSAGFVSRARKVLKNLNNNS